MGSLVAGTESLVGSSRNGIGRTATGRSLAPISFRSTSRRDSSIREPPRKIPETRRLGGPSS